MFESNLTQRLIAVISALVLTAYGQTASESDSATSFDVVVRDQGGFHSGINPVLGNALEY